LDKEDITPTEYKNKFEKIVVKSCLCVGLAASALTVNEIDHKNSDKVSVCPGPNMAYFSKISSLSEMTDHIYGRGNVITRNDRPNMFIKEINLYLDYLKNKIDDARDSMNKKQEKYLLTFSKNMAEGINYYDNLFDGLKHKFEDTKQDILADLEVSKNILRNLHLEIENLTLQLAVVK
jgi:hypothetical protein